MFSCQSESSEIRPNLKFPHNVRQLLFKLFQGDTIEHLSKFYGRIVDWELCLHFCLFYV